jgi:hypothetical protein
MQMKQKIMYSLAILLIFILSSCSGALISTEPSGTTISSTQVSSTTETIVSATPSNTVIDAQSANSETHDDEADYVWDESTEITITLSDTAITSDGAGVAVNGSIATITSAGTYRISGSLSEGQLIVNTTDEETVRLIFDGVAINNSSSSPVYIEDAKKVVIVLADNTTNTLSDGSTYVFASADVDEPNATLFSTADMTIAGNGALVISANYNDGISSKDGLIIAGGTLSVTSVDDGIRGKDYIVVKNGNITIDAQGDGMKSDNEEDATKGYIDIQTGVFNITSGGDAISAQTDVMISAGEFTLLAGESSTGQAVDSTSIKGIKGVVNVNIDGGTFNITSADDSVHSNGNIVINDGTFTIASGDDGMHADSTLTINGGTINITKSYEGLESAVITINDGNIHITSTDDGINVAGGMDSSGMAGGKQRPGGKGGPGGGGPGQDTFTSSGNYFLYINGGYVYADAQGDGIDVNGSITMTDGVVIVDGPSENMNGALDYDGSFAMNGGYFLAVGSAGMAMAPDTSSTQNSILLNLSGSLQPGTLIHLQNSAGKDIFTFAPTRIYQSFTFSSPELEDGETYTVYYGGNSTGTLTDGLYQNGEYSDGVEYTELTISSIVTNIGGGGFKR